MAPESELPELTHRQAEFVRHVLEGKNATDAYRLAYDCENMATATIWRKASDVRHNGKVAASIDAAQRNALLNAECTLEGHLNELARLPQLALENGNFGAAVQAEKIRGEVAGQRTERVQVIPASPQATLDEIAQIGLDLARELARQEGINWQPNSDTPAGRSAH